MTFEEFKYHYWDVFIKYISRYHPLSLELIEKYKYVLDWRMLSANPNVKWNEETIYQHENKFTWHLLSENPGIEISAEFISKYKLRVEWNHLARNPNLPTNDSFINQFLKHYKIEESHPQINQTFIQKYSKHIIPARPVPPPIPQGIENCSLDNFSQNYKQWSYNTYFEIYNRLIKPNLEQNPIGSILKEAIPSPENYFYFMPGNLDKYGLIPSFDPVGDLSSINMETEPQTLKFNQSNLQEGKDRIYSIIKTRGQSYPCMLVSETFLRHLKSFNIPDFIEHRAVLNTKKLKVNENYYFIRFEDNTLINQCEDEHKFEFYFKRHSVIKPKRTLIGNKNNFKELRIEASKNFSESISDIINFYPKRVDIKSNLDIYTLNRKLVFSERLGDSISKFGFGPIELKSTYPMRIFSNKLMVSKGEYISSEPGKIIIEEDNFYHKKKKRLESSSPVFKRFKISNDRISKIEKKLNIIFPKEFLDVYLIGKLIFKDDYLEEEFTWLPIEDFVIENSYSDRYPETYKSCLVASNGIGDYVALLLERNDDHKLSKEFVTFQHETGEVERGKILIIK